MDLALAISLEGEDGMGTDQELLAELDGPEVLEAVVAALSLLGTVRVWDTTQLSPAEIASQKRPDLVFNLAEGVRGSAREAQAPALFEWLGWRYTGSDPVTLAIALDKWHTKSVLRSAGIATPRARLVSQPLENGLTDLEFPLVLKPVAEGSGIGVHESGVVETPSQLRLRICEHLEKYRQPVLVEEYLVGREFTVALIGNCGSWQLLPVVEIDLSVLSKSRYPIYGYEAKWVSTSERETLCPAPLSDDLRQDITTAAVATCDALRVRDWARVDIRLDRHGVPNVLEVNPLPGILPEGGPLGSSGFTLAAMAAGLDYPSMIHRLVRTALARYESQGS